MEKEIEALREQFFKETNIAPVFAERLPYINYINWLEAKMNKQNKIVIVAPTLEVWGNFKKMCEHKGLPYHSLKGLKFPINYKEFEIHKKEVL